MAVLRWMPGGIDPEMLLWLEQHDLLMHGSTLLLSLTGWFLMLRWIHAAVRDLRATLPLRVFSLRPGLTVGLFFVPFLNMFHGFRVLSLLGEATEPEQIPAVDEPQADEAAGYRDPALKAPPAPPAPPPVLAGAWVLLWVMQYILSLLQKHDPQSGLAWLLPPASVASAAITIRVFHALDARISELHRRARAQATGAHAAPEPDHRPLVTNALLWGLVVLAGHSASLVLGPRLPMHGSSLLLFPTFAFVLTPMLASLEPHLRPRWRIAMALSLLALLPGWAALASHNQEASSLRDRAFKALEALDQEHSQWIARKEPATEEELTRLEQKLHILHGKLIEATRHEGNAVAGFFRCKGERTRRKLETQHELVRATLAEEKAHSDADRGRAYRRLAAASRAMLGEYGAEGKETMKACMVSARVSEETLAEMAEPEETRDTELEWLGAEHRVHEAKAEAWERKAAGEAEDSPGGQRSTRTLVAALRDRERLRAQQHPPSPAVEDSPILATRKDFPSKIWLEREEQPFPATPGGMKRTRYLSDPGFLAAYAPQQEPEGEGGAALFLVPSRENMVGELELAGRLARKGVPVFLPTLRGTFRNPGQPDLDFAEISDLAAAYEHLTRGRKVSRAKTVVLGVHEGATRALLLAAAVEARAFVAVEPSFRLAPEALHLKLDARELELRSPVRFVVRTRNPIFLLHGGAELLEADDYRRRALNEEQIHVVQTPAEGFSLERLVESIAAQLDKEGALELRDQGSE